MIFKNILVYSDNNYFAQEMLSPINTKELEQANMFLRSINKKMRFVVFLDVMSGNVVVSVQKRRWLSKLWNIVFKFEIET